MPSQDDELLSRIAARDAAAFTDFVRRHVDGVHGFVTRMTGSAADADDLTQETFLRVWQKARTFRPGVVRPSTWLYRIAHNLCVDRHRRRRPTADAATDTLADARPGPDDALVAEREAAALRRTLATLPERQRAAVLLCRLQGLSNAEAAEVLGVGVRALESLLARARRSLRSALAEGEPR